MSTVENCLECGKPVSTSVSPCPHCKSEYPRGSCCQACKQAVKYSESVKFHQYNFYYECFHNECYQFITQSFQLAPDHIYNYSCPACNKHYQIKTSYSSYSVDDRNVGSGSIYISHECHNCGHFIKIEDSHVCPYSNCYFCTLTLSKSNAVPVIIHDTKRGIETYYAHKLCYDVPNNKQRIAKKNDEVEAIIYKNEKNQFWHSGNNPIGAFISCLVTGIVFFLSNVFWLQLLGIMLFIGAAVTLFEMLKYSS